MSGASITRIEAMTERTPILDILTHLFLIIGILVTGFPIYVALVAATLTPEQVKAKSDEPDEDDYEFGTNPFFKLLALILSSAKEPDIKAYSQ